MLFKVLELLIFVQIGRPQEFFPVLNQLRPSLLLLFLTLFLTVSNKNAHSFSEIIKIKESKLYFYFYIIMILGIPFAIHRKIAFDFVILKYLFNILFFFLLVANITSVERLKKIISVICTAAFFLICMSLLQGNFLQGRFVSGTMFDPNDLAYFLVSFLPLFFIFLGKSESLIKKSLAILSILIFVVSILLTGSRGGGIGFAVVVFSILFSGFLVEKKFFKIVLVLIGCLTIFMYADKINVDRFKSVTDLSSDYNISSDTGRFGIWQRGYNLALSNPITGVGVQCFSKAIGEQRAKEGVHASWQSPHNSFLQVMTETGFIGFGVFVGLLIATLRNFLNLSKYWKENLLQHEANFPGIFLIGLLGSMASAFFLSQAYSIIFTFYFAVSAILRNLSEQDGGLNKVESQLKNNQERN